MLDRYYGIYFGVCYVNTQWGIWSWPITQILAHSSKQKIIWEMACNSKTSLVGTLINQGTTVLNHNDYMEFDLEGQILQCSFLWGLYNWVDKYQYMTGMYTLWMDQTNERVHMWTFSLSDTIVNSLVWKKDAWNALSLLSQGQKTTKTIILNEWNVKSTLIRWKLRN